MLSPYGAGVEDKTDCARAGRLADCRHPSGVQANASLSSVARRDATPNNSRGAPANPISQAR